ncbi:MAG: AMP-binding protein [Aquabacterium sp.]|uniref:fatty acid CoA ligase family protein n=1 Tax=Aquabacterium sp. TaxID=1872578 RepID=UPI0025C56E9F|nr:fatty acid CoA ligase family protein [Aquabacterium sp.]MBI5924158.1 AMP-binding protein [Aquabacterium sp.]
MNRSVTGDFNLYGVMQAQALKQPGRIAFAQARRRSKSGRFLYETRSYGQFLGEVDHTAACLREAGIRRGSKTLMLIRPDLDLPVIVFALFKLGAAPVIIDPAMGMKRLLDCVRKVAPQAMIALPLVHALRPFVGDAFASIELFISTGAARLPATRRLQDIRQSKAPISPMVKTQGSDLAAIFFTSGSTGTPKGVEALHSTLGAQIAHFGTMCEPGLQDVELAAFPVATLISPCLGQTSVIPDMGSMHPGRCKPDNLIQAIEDFGITSGFASPIVWERLSRHCVAKGKQLPSIRRAFSGGAPIPYKMVERLGQLMPQGVMHTPYGATEVTPISTIDAAEIERETARLSAVGYGVCVGKVVPGLEVRIIRTDEHALQHWHDVTELTEGKVGEIVVRGALVSPRYHNDPINTALTKIEASEADMVDGACPFWHRTGDAGYFDKQGRLWFCGRIKHIVQAQGKRYFSVPVEEVLNAETEVWRSALVGVNVEGQIELAMVVEFYPEYKHQISPTRLHAYKARLDSLGFPVRHVLPYPKAFPVDKRHNSKIERPILAEWAQVQINKGVRS